MLLLQPKCEKIIRIIVWMSAAYVCKRWLLLWFDELKYNKKVAFVSSYHVINVVAGSVKSILSTSSGGCVIMMISFEIVL